MLRIPPPATPVRQAVDDALTSETDPVRAGRISADLAVIETATALAAGAFLTDSIATFPPSSFQTTVATKADMYVLFDSRIAKAGSGGRRHYDAVVLSARHTCPYCALQIPRSVDHYLPRKDYWGLAASPVNLVPACSDCNRIKSSYAPTVTRPALLHPYFDDVSTYQWLRGRVVQIANEPAIEYFVDTAAIPLDLGRRIENHFRVLRLAEMYSAYAAQVIANLSLSLPRLAASLGEAGLADHLAAEAVIAAPSHPNSWQRVLLHTLSADAWFVGLSWSSRADDAA
jgi:hypothetical protein